MPTNNKGKSSGSRSKTTAKNSSSGRRTNSAAASSRSRSTSSGRKTTAKSGSGKSMGSRSSAKRKTTAQQNRRIEEYRNPMVGSEVVLWVIVCLAALVFISFAGMGGQFGATIRNIFFGTFGVLAYIVPFFVFGIAVYLTVTGGSKGAVKRTVWLCILFILFCGLMQMALLGWSGRSSLSDYYKACAYYRTGGGIIGGLLVTVLCPLFGKVGACIVMGIAAIICIVVISQKAIIATFGEQRGEAARMRIIAAQMRREAEETRGRYVQENPRADGPQDTESYADDVPLNDFKLERRKRRPAAEQPTVFTLEPEPAGEPAGGAKSSSKTAAPEVPAFTITRADEPSSEWEDSSFVEEDGPSPEELLRRANQPVEKKASQGDKASGSRGAAAADAKKTGSSKASAAEAEESGEDVEEEINEAAAETRAYVFPPIDLLSAPSGPRKGPSTEDLRETAAQLQQVLETFGVKATVTNVTCGPSVTRYELIPDQGVRVNRIVALSNDIKLSLAAQDIRIQAPIPGKSAIGIEIPNKETSKVYVRELLESEAFRTNPSALAYVVGKDIGGKIIVSDISKMPHLLIAGATGSGKSVFINTLIMSILYHASPQDVRLIMIDPKVVELSVYNGIPHLLIPVVTDPKKAAGALNWGVAEMMKRYDLFAKAGVRDLRGYNAKMEELEKEYEAAVAAGTAEGERPVKLQQIVIIVDELADLMMVASGEVEDAIVRLTQLARAAGIHLVIATQRPSVDVITGLIKANIPSRIAFMVSSAVDSRTILDMSGAEKLLGNGDMLFSPQNFKVPARVQGAFVSDEEVAEVVAAIREQNPDEHYAARMEKNLTEVDKSAASSAAGGGSDTDELFADAGKLLIEKDKASIGMLQRAFKIGFNRAARIMDQLADAGVVGPEEGTKPRKILMSMEDFENYLEQN